MSSDFENSSYLYGANETYLAQMYARYLEDPSSVDPEWTEVFKGLEDDEAVFERNSKEPVGRRANFRDRRQR